MYNFSWCLILEFLETFPLPQNLQKAGKTHFSPARAWARNRSLGKRSSLAVFVKEVDFKSFELQFLATTRKPDHI